MENTDLSLKASVREETGRKLNQLRGQGKIPAVLYGHKIKPTHLTVDYLAFDKLYKQAGDSTLVDLIVNDKKPVKVLVQDHQSDPVSDMILHIDFLQVNMDEKIHTEIPLKFIGEPPAVKEFSGVLITSLNTLSIECLPNDLVKEIEVDLTSIKTFDDIIHVKDIKVADILTVKNNEDDVVAQVQPPRVEEEAVSTPAEGEEIEEGAEGEESAEGAPRGDAGDPSASDGEGKQEGSK